MFSKLTGGEGNLKGILFAAAVSLVALVVAVPANAQEITKDKSVAAQTASLPTMQSAVSSGVPQPETYKKASDGSDCELHVWPTHNYLGMNLGLLSGFGLVGALADVAAHEGHVKTVKDLMKDYLGPEIQMEELNKIGIAKTLKLDGYRIVLEEPTPFNEDLKNNPDLKAKVKAMNDRVKAKQRLSDSTAKCYAELVTTMIFYQKAMMYGSNLFTGWIYRDFGDKPIAIKIGTGMVKNPLEEFPPKSEDKVAVAKLELRDAFSKDFVEYVQKKVQP